jgi:hypothetical protein
VTLRPGQQLFAVTPVPARRRASAFVKRTPMGERVDPGVVDEDVDVRETFGKLVPTRTTSERSERSARKVSRTLTGAEAN